MRRFLGRLAQYSSKISVQVRFSAMIFSHFKRKNHVKIKGQEEIGRVRREFTETKISNSRGLIVARFQTDGKQKITWFVSLLSIKL